VRKAEQLAAGDVVRMTLELLDPDGTRTGTEPAPAPAPAPRACTTSDERKTVA
jgi:hypothetical protein